MKQLLIFVLIATISLVSQAQLFRSYMDDSGMVKQCEIPYLTKSALSGDTLAQPEGWPIGFVRNPSFQNFRGLTLEYLDDVPGQEIIAGINDSLYVLHGDGSRLWSAKLDGTAIYPASTADIDNDGEMDIVIVTGGVPYNGHVYAFDHLGNLKPGWPVSVASCWYICAPVLVDLDGDFSMEIIACEFNTSQPVGQRNRIHIYNHDGSNFSDDWPQNLPHRPAVTPSVADVNMDGNPDILVCSTDSLYLFDLQGNNIDPFPWSLPGMKFSYQSPIIIDYRSSPFEAYPIEIIGANHGDNPGYYKIIYTSAEVSMLHWNTDDMMWTYSTPMAFGGQNTMWYEFVSQPLGDYENGDSCIFNMCNSGQQADLPEINVVRYDGLEGFMSYDGYSNFLFTGSNCFDEYGNGYLHIYNCLNTSFTEIAGLPVKVKGKTFMNGINLGDVNGDDMLDMIILGCSDYPDSTYINVIEMTAIDDLGFIPYFSPEYVVPGYKGKNSREGRTEPVTYETINAETKVLVNVYPNPANEVLYLQYPADLMNANLAIYDNLGRLIMQRDISTEIDISGLASGMYSIKITSPAESGQFIKIIVE